MSEVVTCDPFFNCNWGFGLGRVKIASPHLRRSCLLLIFAPCPRHIELVARCRLYKTLLPRMKSFYWPFQHILIIQNLAALQHRFEINWLWSLLPWVSKMKQLSAKDFPTKIFVDYHRNHFDGFWIEETMINPDLKLNGLFYTYIDLLHHWDRFIIQKAWLDRWNCLAKWNFGKSVLKGIHFEGTECLVPKNTGMTMGILQGGLKLGGQTGQHPCPRWPHWIWKGTFALKIFQQPMFGMFQNLR